MKKFKTGQHVKCIRNYKKFELGKIYLVQLSEFGDAVVRSCNGSDTRNGVVIDIENVYLNFELYENIKPKSELEWIKWFSGDRE